MQDSVKLDKSTWWRDGLMAQQGPSGSRRINQALSELTLNSRAFPEPLLQPHDFHFFSVLHVLAAHKPNLNSGRTAPPVTEQTRSRTL